jgi:hypothetical protein
MTPSPDLIQELQASRPVAPAALRTHVRETAQAPQASPTPFWDRLRLPVRRVALVAVPAALALSIVSAGVVGLSHSEGETAKNEAAPTPVLVAKQLIPKGTPGNIVASQSLYVPTTLPRKEVEVGAITDPSYLTGRAAAADIFPGQQFTATDFGAADTLSVDSQLHEPQRAAPIAIDGAGQSAGQDTTIGPTPGRAQRVSATLTVEVRDANAVSTAAQDALQLTRSLGGHVVRASVSTGEQGTASLTVRVPVAKVQQAIAELAALGRIVSQDVTIDDLQASLDELEGREASLRTRIARIRARLETESLDAQTEATLRSRLATLRAELAEVREAAAVTTAEARMSTIQLSVVTSASQVVAPIPSRLDRALDEALSVLAWEGVIALAVAIVAAPFALLFLSAWVTRRIYRRREDERLLST